MGKDIEFINKLKINENVWVAMSKERALAFSNDKNELDIPVWNTMEESQEFLDNTSHSITYNPVEVPLDTFKAAWLSNDKLRINDLIICPNGKNAQDLVLTRSELINQLWH